MNSNKIIKTLFWIVVAVLLVRLISLGFNPMFDTTEARYAEVGRLMFENGNWITPMFDYGVPFWGKPPMSFWATAASFHIFGVNDFAAHLPHFLFMLGIVVLMYFFVKKHLGKMTAMVSSAVLVTMTMFLYLMGGVMTDPAFALCVTMAFIGFYNALYDENHSRRWWYVFFAGLGLALLAKGPLVFPIVGMPIFLFVLIKNKWRDMFKNLPWITGTLLMLAIALPWYLLAERATPGFLNYFIVGEHYLRYVTPQWQGDLYGAGHGGYPGQIIKHWFESLLPWLIWLVIMLFYKKFRASLKSLDFVKNDFLFFMLLNIAATLAFFAFATNVIPTYVLTIMAPSAVLVAWLIAKYEGPTIGLTKFKIFAGLNIFVFVALIGVGIAYPKWSADIGRTDKYLVTEYKELRADENTKLFYFLRRPTFSARYYSDGLVIRTETPKDIADAAKESSSVFIIMRNSDNPRGYEFGELKKTIVTAGKKTTLIKIEP